MIKYQILLRDKDSKANLWDECGLDLTAESFRGIYKKYCL